MSDESFKVYIRRLIKQNGMVGKLILINTAVFIFFLVLFLIEKLFMVKGLEGLVKVQFAAPGDITQLIYKPWAIITQLFTHGDLFHFLFNMLMLFFTAQFFVRYFGEKRLLTTYLLGGIFAYLFHVGCYYIFPLFSSNPAPPIIGASGAISAIFMAICFYRPRERVMVFGLIPAPMIALAIVYILVDLSNVGSGDNVAHMAHLGGGIFGALSIVNVNSSRNFMNRIEKWLSKFKWSNLFKRKPKFNVHQGGAARSMSDEEYNANKTVHQDRIDAILDKISKKGYEGLTKEEKEILFNESKRKQ